jgi:hypothetical protein
VVCGPTAHRHAKALHDQHDLLAACKSLEGATMPNGQKYEDWLTSKGRGDDGENSDSS